MVSTFSSSCSASWSATWQLSTTAPMSATVPGLGRMLGLALQKYGTKPRKEVIAPAIKLAEDGFTLEQGDVDMSVGLPPKDYAELAKLKARIAHGGASRNAATGCAEFSHPAPVGERPQRREAPLVGRPITSYAGASEAARTYRELAKEVGVLTAPPTGGDDGP